MDTGTGLLYLGLAGTFLEIGVLWLGLFLIFEQRDCTFVEAGAYAGLTTLMALTFFVRLVFLAGVPRLAVPFELAAIAGAAFLIWRRRAGLAKITTPLAGFLKGTPWMAGCFFLGGAYLLAQAVLLPPTIHHWKALAPVFWLERFATEAWGPAAGHPPAPASQHALLTYLVLRWQLVARLLLVYPEVHFFTVAVLIVIGRYTGYQIVELWRFRDMSEAES